MTYRLMRGRALNLSRLCQEFVPAGLIVLAEHADSLPRDLVAKLREAMTLLRRIDQDARSWGDTLARNAEPLEISSHRS